MTQNTTLLEVLDAVVGADRSRNLYRSLNLSRSVAQTQDSKVSRAVLAQALNMLLFERLVESVPAAKRYVAFCLERGSKVTHDHGAVRTVALSGMGGLPAGQEAITRILEPLGYRLNGLYPLEKLKMTGRSWAQEDDPEGIAQFFLSELHPERFSAEFRRAVERVTASSKDPLHAEDAGLLEEMRRNRFLSVEQAVKVLPGLVACFGRQHEVPELSEYELLLGESAEMAWISTEGNAFNHVTDRVEDVDRLSEEQRALGQPMKAVVERSQTGRVRQTAFHAARVQREFRTPAGMVKKEVPGSFLEFITRLTLPEGGALDLSFDSSNAQGIFKMTADAEVREKAKI